MTSKEMIRQAEAWSDKVDLYVAFLIGLFALASLMTALWIYWPFKDEGEE